MTDGIIRIDPKSIIIADRLREVDEDVVDAICAVGLRDELHPIIVRPVCKDGELRPSEVHLVAGGHRLAAALRLEVPLVHAIEKMLDDDHARLVEIEENMIRKGLKGLERAAFLAEWKRIYDDRHPETKAGGDRKSKSNRNKSDLVFPFSKVAAKKLECDRSTIDKSVAIYTNLPADVRKRLIGTKLAEKQSDLLYLASLDPSVQRKAVTLLGDGEAATIKAAVAVVNGAEEPASSSKDKQFTRLLDAWSRAGRDVKAQFLVHLRELGELEA